MKLLKGSTASRGPARRIRPAVGEPTWRPVFLQEKCTGCRTCAMVCPDGVVYALDKKKYTCDLDYCKGCGICAEECPVGGIKMVPECGR